MRRTRHGLYPRKECIGYQTDSRRFALDYNNLMIENALNGGLALTLDQLSNLVKAAMQRTNRK